MLQDINSQIVLTGEDARNFYRKFFHPTKEEIEKDVEVMEKLNDIKINNTKDGFEVEISDLDLSFLEEE